MRACFVRGGALGDFVLTMPVLRALFDDGHEVDVVAAPRLAPLVALCGAPRRLWDVDALESAWTLGGAAPEAYDFAVCFSAARANVFPCRDTRWVTERPPPGVEAWRHFASVYPCRPAWTVSSAERRYEVVLAPGASTGAKSPPMDWWMDLHAALPGSRLVGGPLEPWAEFRPDLAGLVALATRARLWVGPDSGPTHLAARLGATTHAVVRDPQWLPLGARAWAWDTSPGALAAALLPGPGNGGRGEG